MLEPIIINHKQIEIISSCTVLGVNISADVKWNKHVKVVCGKIAWRLYFLKQLKAPMFYPTRQPEHSVEHASFTHLKPHKAKLFHLHEVIQVEKVSNETHKKRCSALGAMACALLNCLRWEKESRMPTRRTFYCCSP